MKLEFISIQSIQIKREIISVKKGEEGGGGVGFMIVNLNVLFVFVDG